MKNPLRFMFKGRFHQVDTLDIDEIQPLSRNVSKVTMSDKTTRTVKLGESGMVKFLNSKGIYVFGTNKNRIE